LEDDQNTALSKAFPSLLQIFPSYHYHALVSLGKPEGSAILKTDGTYVANAIISQVLPDPRMKSPDTFLFTTMIRPLNPNHLHGILFAVFSAPLVVLLSFDYFKCKRSAACSNLLSRVQREDPVKTEEVRR
jgi:hypothetical protein